MSKKTILEVKNLKISSKKNYLIHDLSFKVNYKEILGIVGESGSGKSLTALSIIDLIKYKGLKQEKSLKEKFLFSKTTWVISLFFIQIYKKQ